MELRDKACPNSVHWCPPSFRSPSGTRRSRGGGREGPPAESDLDSSLLSTRRTHLLLSSGHWQDHGIHLLTGTSEWHQLHPPDLRETGTRLPPLLLLCLLSQWCRSLSQLVLLYSCLTSLWWAMPHTPCCSWELFRENRFRRSLTAILGWTELLIYKALT